MSCNTPMMAIRGEKQESGKYKYRILGRYALELVKDYPDAIPLPCGKCIGCRLDYAKQWADRMVLELDHSKKAVFITLTYNEDNCPRVVNEETGESFMTLRKTDCAQFLKRLRNYYKSGTLRFYANGEYGTLRHRPHIHIILFGLDLRDLDYANFRLEFFSYNKFGSVNYRSHFLEHVWEKGNVIVTTVTWETCAYVARYNLKKLKNGIDEEYEFIEKEFSTSSRRPGIGMYYIQEHPDCFEYTNIPLSSGKTLKGIAKKLIIPKQFLKKLEETNPEFYESIKLRRKKAAEDIMFSRLSVTDEGFLEIKKKTQDMVEKSVKYLDFDAPLDL